MKKLLLVILLLGVLIISACGAHESVEIENGSRTRINSNRIEASVMYVTFEEALELASCIVIAQYIGRRPFGQTLMEFEFVILERILGDTEDRIFVYVDNMIMSSGSTSNASDALDFSSGIDYLLILDHRVSPYFHAQEDMFMFIANAVIDLNNPINSTMWNEPLYLHSSELSFNVRDFSRQQIVAHIAELTRYNPPINDIIRSDAIDDILYGSPYVLVVEINEPQRLSNRQLSQDWMSTDIYHATIISVLKSEGDIATWDEIEVIFFADTVFSNEQHIVAVRPISQGSSSFEFTSRNSLFSMDQQDEIQQILGNLARLTFNLNGGQNQANFSPQIIGDGGTATHPANDPTRSNFIFAGWFTHPYEGDDNTAAFDFATPITENTTIYARWTPMPPRIHHIDRGASVIRGSGISGATVRVYLPCTSIVYAVAPVCANGNWTVDISAAGHQPLRGGSVVYASQTVDGRISDRSHRDVSNYAAPTVGLRFFYEWRVSAVGRPGNVMAGHGVTLTIFLENADVIDAHDIVLRICAFDWLPYHQMIRIGGSIDMYHCVASGQLIFNVGTLLSGDYAIFTVTAQATRSVDRGAIADRDITFTARYGNSTPPVEFMELYEWRVDATGRPGNVVAGGSVTFIIFLQNTDIIDAHDVVMRICAFDWLPYYRMFQIGGSIDMYHCVASGQLIFNVGTLQSGDFAMFTLTAPATKSVSRDMIADRQITITANAA